MIKQTLEIQIGIYDQVINDLRYQLNNLSNEPNQEKSIKMALNKQENRRTYCQKQLDELTSEDCYKTGANCKYDCGGICKESC